MNQRDLKMAHPQRIEMQAIGVVHTSASQDEIRRHKEGLTSLVEIFPQYVDALDGLKGFSHIIIVAFLDQLRSEQIGLLKVRPRRLLRRGVRLEDLPLLGVFALDSPTRPNPIGLSVVSLLRIEGMLLTVTDLDLFDGTPVLDIKPYQSGYRAERYSVPEWYERLHRDAGYE